MKKICGTVARRSGCFDRRPASAFRKAEADLWREATTELLSHAGRAIAPGAGDVAQLAEHRLCKAGVEGSSPFVSTRSVTRSTQVSGLVPLLGRLRQPVICFCVPLTCPLRRASWTFWLIASAICLSRLRLACW